MASDYPTYNGMHADFHSQPSPTYRPWPGTSFDHSKSSCDIPTPLFASPAHGSESEAPLPNPHYFLQGSSFSHSPNHENQSIAYPESSQRTHMDDTAPYLPMYDTPHRPTDPSAQTSILPGRPYPVKTTGLKFGDSTSRHLADSSGHSRYTEMRAPYHLNTSETSLSSYRYRVTSPSSQSSPQCSSPTHHSTTNLTTEFARTFLSVSTPISSQHSPISPYPNNSDLRPTMLTLQMSSLDVVDDPDTLSSVIDSRGDILDRKSEQIFSPTSGTLSPMNGTHNPEAPYSRNMFVEDSSNPARSNSSLSSSSSSASGSDYATAGYSSFPNGVGAHGRTPILTSASRTSRKNKMHRCEVCGKSFPRPSGLKTHMNSHEGKKPYKCMVSGCAKAFAVRSNAKRHLRTHGLSTLPSTSSQTVNTTFTVGFDAPFVSNTYDSGVIPKLKWVQQGPTTRTAMDWPDSPSGSDEADGGASPMSALQPTGHVFGIAQGYVGAPHQYHPSQGPSAEQH